MDELPDSLLLQILSRLDNSKDVARCRVASKAFNDVFPELRSVNLRCTMRQSLYWSSRAVYKKKSKRRVSNSSRFKRITPFRKVFLDIISKLKAVESISVSDSPQCGVDLCDEAFIEKWLPRVSESLKSLSICGHRYDNHPRQSNVLPLISAHCHNLVNLTLGLVWLSVENLNPMPMLTSLKLLFTRLDDEQLDELNKCFPNLKILNLRGVKGLKDPEINLLHLQTCYLTVYNPTPSLNLITPNLITLEIECLMHYAHRYEPPMTSEFHLGLCTLDNLRTLSLASLYIGSLVSEFRITKTVENLTLDLRNYKGLHDVTDSRLTLQKVFTVFPNVSHLCIRSGAWSELEGCLNSEDWEILDGRKGLESVCAYLMLVDESLTFSCFARVLDQCIALSKVSLLVYDHVVGTVSESFKSKCMARWPGLKWKWGIWSEGRGGRFLDKRHVN